MSYYYIFCLRKQAQHSLQFIHTSYLGAGMQCDKGNLDSGLKYALPCSSCYKRLLPKKCNLQRAYMQQKLPGICRDTFVSAFMTQKRAYFIPGVSILSRRTFCVQEVLMYMCLLSFHLNALFGLTPVAIYPTVKLNEKGVNKLAEARTIGTVGIIR